MASSKTQQTRPIAREIENGTEMIDVVTSVSPFFLGTTFNGSKVNADISCMFPVFTCGIENSSQVNLSQGVLFHESCVLGLSSSHMQYDSLLWDILYREGIYVRKRGQVTQIVDIDFRQRNTVDIRGSKLRPIDPEACVYLFAVESLSISDSFKRTQADNEGILRKKREFRGVVKAEEQKEYRRRSKERTQRGRSRIHEIYPYIDIAEEYEKQCRTHSKREDRTQRRREHRMLLQSKERHQIYLKSKQIERRMLRENFGELMDLFSNATLMVETLGDEKKDPDHEPFEGKEIMQPKFPITRQQHDEIARDMRGILNDVRMWNGMTAKKMEIKKSPPTLSEQMKKRLDRISHKITHRFDTVVSETSALLKSAAGKTGNIFEDLKATPIHSILVQCMRGDIS